MGEGISVALVVAVIPMEVIIDDDDEETIILFDAIVVSAIDGAA